MDVSTTTLRETGISARLATVASEAGWRLVGRLARTPLSEVFRAQPLECSLERPADYVVKAASGDSHSVSNALIQREARIGFRIRSPHVGAILELHTQSEPNFLVMPYLEGATVADRLQRFGRLPLAIALWVVRQVVEGLEAIHGAGFLHGDIKPENMIVASNGHLTLTDLAFARPLDVMRGETDCLMTTLRYAAPELFLAGERIGRASDVYSLGVAFYEILSGSSPFSICDADASTLVAAHLEARPAELSLVGCSPRLPVLLRRMLSKQPLRRPSLAELRQELVELEIEHLGDRVA